MSKSAVGIWWAVILLATAGAADRWIHLRQRTSPAHTVGASRVEQMPEVLGDWTGELAHFDEGLIKTSRSVAEKCLRFRDPATGATINMALLVGLPGDMTDHPPEKAFRLIGYAFDSESLKRKDLRGDVGLDLPGELAAMDFWNRDSKEPLRVWQGWFDGEQWSRPEHGRFWFWNKRMLYRLQVWAPMMPDPNADDDDVRIDAVERFLRSALPIITKQLAEGDAPPVHATE